MLARRFRLLALLPLPLSVAVAGLSAEAVVVVGAAVMVLGDELASEAPEDAKATLALCCSPVVAAADFFPRPLLVFSSLFFSCVSSIAFLSLLVEASSASAGVAVAFLPFLQGG